VTARPRAELRSFPEKSRARSAVRSAPRARTRSYPARPEPIPAKTSRSRGFERRGRDLRPQPSPRTRKAARPGTPRRRFAVIRIVVVLLFGALAVRLVAVQILSSTHYSKIGSAELTTTVTVPPQRGGIFDRSGAVLAVSVPVSTVVGDPFLISHPVAEANALAPVLGVPEPQLQADLSEHSGFVYLAREVGQQVAQKVRSMQLTGINLLPDTKRVEPSGQLAAPVVGTDGADGAGQGGIEYQYQKLLSGHGGTAKEELSPSGVALPGSIEQIVPATSGTGVELTLDQPLQYVTEQSLASAITSSHAKSGIAVVMNTHTGEILAMANLVADPSTGKVSEASQNLALTQVYEPGSVFKVVTFSASLAEGLISPNTVLTVPNTLLIDGWTFHDAESHATEQLTATQILAQSSNIGTIEIAEGLGKSRLAQQIANLGFGAPTGLHFPGESEGLVKPDTASWSGSDIGSTPIGQDDAVTAQQVLDMINSVATGGVYVPPRLVRATVSNKGTVKALPAPATRRVFSPQVSAELTTMMQQVVQDGTAVSAGVPGYSVAGKTGTAQIPDPVHGGYVPGAYMATFAGFAPAQNPALSAIVVLDQPTPIFGGVVAAPVFSQVMQYALHRYGVPPWSPGTAGGKSAPAPFPTGHP
jgi:cell division protein FtsI (penicillin-binding protein 3)